MASTDLEDQLSAMRGAIARSPILEGKLDDLQVVFSDLEKEMSRLYIDEEDRLAELAEHIPDSSYIRGAEIWVDGFHGFTPQEFVVLRELMQQASKLTVSLTLDRSYPYGDQLNELELFHPTAVTYIKLRGIAEELGMDVWDELLEPAVLPRFEESPALAHLERGYDRRKVWFGADELANEAISIGAAVSHRAEVEGALREMIRLARDEGAKYGEMAVLMRNIGDYEQLIKPLFQDYGVPFFWTRR